MTTFKTLTTFKTVLLTLLVVDSVELADNAELRVFALSGTNAAPTLRPAAPPVRQWGSASTS